MRSNEWCGEFIPMLDQSDMKDEYYITSVKDDCLLCIALNGQKAPTIAPRPPLISLKFSIPLNPTNTDKHEKEIMLRKTLLYEYVEKHKKEKNFQKKISILELKINKESILGFYVKFLKFNIRNV